MFFRRTRAGRYCQTAVICRRLAVFSFLAVTTLFGGRGKPKYGGIFAAVMPYGCNFLAVGGSSFFGGNDFGRSGKPKYGGTLSAVMQYGGNCLAVKQYGGNFLEVGGFSFFGGNVNVNSKLGGNCGA